MVKFIAGMIVGLCIGAAVTVKAAQLVGEDGSLTGWDVNLNGEQICSDPDVSIITKEIDCTN